MAVTRYLALAFAAVLLASTSAPASAETIRSPERESVLVEILGSQFTTFVSLLEQADLLGVLEKELKELDGVTIFIPTDFHLLHKVSPSLLSFLRQPKNMALLQKVLLYHFLPYRVGASEWDGTYQTLEGSEAQLVARGAAFEVEGHSVREMDALIADDGAVHALNGFLIPADLKSILARFMAERSSDYLPLSLPERRVLIKMPTRSYHSFAATSSRAVVSTVAAAAPAPAPAAAAPPPSVAPAPAPGSVSAVNDETLLVSALEKLGDYKIFLSLLQMTGLGAVLARYKGPLTLLVPDDKAFMAIEANGQLATLSQDKDVLTVLLYHAIPGYYPQNALLTKSSLPGKAAAVALPTLANVSLPVTSSGGVVYFGNPPVAVTTPNIVSTTAGSGGGFSVQGLDGVLIPPGLLAGTPVGAPSPSPSPPTSSAPAPAPGTKGAGAKNLMDVRYLVALAVVLAGALLL